MEEASAKYLVGQLHFGDGVVEPENLREHLVVKHKIVGVGGQRKAFQNFARKSAVAGVVFGKFGAQQQVFRRREEAVGHVFPQRHAAAQARNLPKMRLPSTQG